MRRQARRAKLRLQPRIEGRDVTENAPRHLDAPALTVEFRLLGRVPFPAFLALQNRLMFEAGAQDRTRIVVLLCEHPTLITVGRSGSRGHIRLTDKQLRRDRIAVRWVGRGGGGVLHGPGQLAIYPIVPLDQVGWSVGQYMRRLQSAVVGLLERLNISARTRRGIYGVHGRTGLLAAAGVVVRRQTTGHGVFINVNPQMQKYAFIDTDPMADTGAGEKTTMGCLLAERRSGIRMTGVRAALIESMAEAFESPQYHLFTGHPWLASQSNEPG